MVSFGTKIRYLLCENLKKHGSVMNLNNFVTEINVFTLFTSLQQKIFF